MRSVRELVLRCLGEVAGAQAPEDLDERADLLRSGVVDSLGYLTLLGRIGERLGRELDISDYDPAEFVTIAGLIRIAEAAPVTQTPHPELTAEELRDALSAVGVARGDRLMVHSSIDVFGMARGGVGLYAEILMECLGEDGTLVVPTFTFGFCRGEPFDQQRTPSEGMGVFSELVRRLPPARRTPHAIQSLSAVGRDAMALCAMDTPSAYQDDSAFAELERQDFKILLLGASSRSVSLVHLCEERARVPYRFMKTFTGRVRIDDVEGERSYLMYARMLELSPDVNEDRVTQELVRRTQWREEPLRQGRLALCSVRDYTRATGDILARDPFGLLDNADAVRSQLIRPQETP